MSQLLLIAALALLAACQEPPAPHPSTTSAASPATQLKAEGDALMARGDHASALAKYRQAADLEPTSVPIRFALGTAYSFLDKRLEAIAQFRWVVASASAGSSEYREARRWLVRVGALVEPAGAGGASEAASSEASSKEPETTTKQRDPAAIGSISGKTQWPGLTPAQQPVNMSVLLVGDEESTRDVKRRAGVAIGDSYEFRDLPAGRYRVVATYLEDTVLWDRQVAVEAGKQTEAVLAKADSRMPAYEFPEARTSRQ